jgi:hypothetical protein
MSAPGSFFWSLNPCYMPATGRFVGALRNMTRAALGVNDPGEQTIAQSRV